MKPVVKKYLMAREKARESVALVVVFIGCICWLRMDFARSDSPTCKQKKNLIASKKPLSSPVPLPGVRSARGLEETGTSYLPYRSWKLRNLGKRRVSYAESAFSLITLSAVVVIAVIALKVAALVPTTPRDPEALARRGRNEPGGN